MSSRATIEDTEVIAKLNVLLREWEQERGNGFPSLDADVVATRQKIRMLAQRSVAEPLWRGASADPSKE